MEQNEVMMVLRAIHALYGAVRLFLHTMYSCRIL